MPHARYLLPESIAQIQHLIKMHPLGGPLLLLGVFGVVLGVLRRIFGRIAVDMLVFAGIIWLIVMVFGSAAFTFIHVKGFHFGG